MVNGSLIQVETADKLYLHGYFSPNSNNNSVLLHIHGFEGNFYENKFIYSLTEKFENDKIGLLIVNTRGNGKDTDINATDGSLKRIGARFELLEEAHLDISAWIKFLFNKGYKQIYLSGHSLGTYKVVRYLFEGEFKDRISKLILLSPFDKNGLMIVSHRNINELLSKAQAMVDNGRGNDLVTKEFEDIEISYKTFISWYKQDDFSRMFEFCSKDYDFPILRQIKLPTKIIVGSKDEYFHQSNPGHPEEAMEILLKNIPKSEGKIIEGAVHSFSPHEDLMADEVVKFLH